MSENMFYCSFVGVHYIICECGKTCPTEEALKQHLESEHPNQLEKKEYRCGSCDKVFSTEKACIQHHQKTHVLKLVKVKKEDIPAFLRKDNEPPRKREKTKVPFLKLKNVICEVCGKKWASNAALRYHQRVHTGERPYACIYCTKKFTMPLYLQIHLRTHTGERPYQCSQCTKAFSNKAALLRHDRVHTGEKPYKCPKCGKSFTQSNSMKLHVHTVHLKLPAPYKSKRRKAEGLLRALKSEDSDAADRMLKALKSKNKDTDAIESVLRVLVSENEYTNTPESILCSLKSENNDNESIIRSLKPENTDGEWDIKTDEQIVEWEIKTDDSFSQKTGNLGLYDMECVPKEEILHEVDNIDGDSSEIMYEVVYEEEIV